ncbi:hypothetical protein PAXINDRAFT_6981 [Paxillus involutus ATCC 200175]|nr:hypothetical protein PAXINDRAFT_6981 [Paxillus involutus ATCC 200175]
MLPEAPNSVGDQDEEIYRQMGKFDQECLNLIRATNEALTSDGEGDYDEGFDHDSPTSPRENVQEEFGGTSADLEEQEDFERDNKPNQPDTRHSNPIITSIMQRPFETGAH